MTNANTQLADDPPLADHDVDGQRHDRERAAVRARVRGSRCYLRRGVDE